jgi:hypothetical protein
MSPDPHAAARKLIAQERVEGLPDTDREWLLRHLDECAACAGEAEATGRALRAFRAIPVSLPPGLASRTQSRVYLRAIERRKHRGSWAVWAACAISWAVGIASAPFVWRMFRWLGAETGLPEPLWKAGFLFWWIVPALVTVAVVLIEGWRKEGLERSDYVE